MPINNNNFVVFDFETGSTNVYQETCEPLELAAVIVSGRTLQVVEGSEFQSFIKPYDEKNLTSGALAVGGKTQEQISEYLDNIRKAPTRKEVFESFCSYLSRYRTGKNMWGNCIPVGHNIISFDLPLLNRLCIEFGKISTDGRQTILHPIHVSDTMNHCFHWFENMGVPEKTKYGLSSQLFWA
jgi:DNA polymerase III epsilon subunit-like protein